MLNRSSDRFTTAVGTVLLLIQSRARLPASAIRVFSSVLVSWLVQAQTAHVELIVIHYELYQNHWIFIEVFATQSPHLAPTSGLDRISCPKVNHFAI